MVDRAATAGTSAGAELARLLADAAAGVAEAETRLDAWLRAELEPLLRERLGTHARLTLADAGALVQRYWQRASRENTPPSRGGGRRKAGKAAKGAQGTRPPHGVGLAGAQGSPSDTTHFDDAVARSLYLSYVQRAAGAMQGLVIDLVARTEPAALPKASNDLPIARVLHVLHALESLESRLALTVRLRWFGGLDLDALAHLLEDDPTEVRRRWHMACAFLWAAGKNDRGPRRGRGKGPAGVAAPLPDAATWQRIALLFDTGTELPQEVRANWLGTLGREEPAATVSWLRHMFAAAEAPGFDKALERGPRLPPWTEPGAAGTVEQATAPPGAPDPATPAPADVRPTDDTPTRAAAPPLATGMRLGPWRLVGPMTSSDVRVDQWRVRRADEASEDGPGAEMALLIPRQWRPRQDLAAWLAHAAAAPMALAHPHIARIAAVGLASDGTPWIATELAEGQRIDRWCRDHSLTLPQRRLLMEQALEAARFAQGRLVLHGQVHPSQVIVSPDGRLRWLNFGLSRLLSVLDVPQVPDTPAAGGPPPSAYLAPEQGRPGAETVTEPADGAAGATSEVHALGLVLFEVLSGASPWQPPAPGRAEPLATGTQWRRPSDLAATLRQRRALRGDLDAIVAKATQSDPALRYASVAELLDDLHRAGSHRPVAARGDALRYEVGRMARRHPVLAATVLATVAAGLVVLGALSFKSMSWLRERDDAVAAWRNSEAVSRLMQDLLHDTSPGSENDWPQRLLAAEAAARASLKEQPASLGSALAWLGREHAERGAFAEGRNLLAEALPLLAGQAPSLEATCDEAWAQARQGDNAGAAEQRLRLVAESAAVRPVTRALCLARLADLERHLGRLRDAYQTTHLARAQWNASADKPPQLAVLLARPMGSLSAALGRFHESQLWFEWTMKHVEALQQRAGPSGIELGEQWGEVLLAAGDAQGAQKLADANLTALAGTTSPVDVDPALAPPAALYYAAAEPRLELHQMADARARLEAALSLAEARGDATLGRRARCLLAVAALREGDAGTAERWLKPVAPDNPSSFGHATAGPVTGAASSPAAPAAPTPPQAADNGIARAAHRDSDHVCRAASAELALLQGRLNDAQRIAERLLAAGDDLAPRLRASMALLRAEAGLAARQREQAVGAALQALQQARALHQSDVGNQDARPSFRSGQAALVLAEAHRANGDVDEAKKTLDYALQQLSATLPETHPWRRRAEATKAALAVHAPKKP